MGSSDMISKIKHLQISDFQRLASLYLLLQIGIYPRQGCALREITRSPKFPNYEIQRAQHKAYMKEIRLSGCPKAKVSRLRHPGTLRAQPCQGYSHISYVDMCCCEGRVFNNFNSRLSGTGYESQIAFI